MRNTLRLTLLTFVVSTAWSGLALAQGAAPTATAAPANPHVTFIDMVGLELTGVRARPRLAFVNASQRAKFERLMKLRHDVIGSLRTTACDPALR